ncbi:MAG: Dam family site-specific DNA-(adenine-N6)-methyltransferase [Nitrospinae bacterium]|nr:Dam family site-specific DNA-(adenine-N6)-methyltransferase [Nitrospinota bacterium]
MSVDHPINPFLRWAGGKRWLRKHLNAIIKIDNYDNYHEPFLGGASIFLSLIPKNVSYLSDCNSELIDTFKSIKEDPLKVIEELSKFKNNKQDYYLIREIKFKNPWKKAAQFIYLNQTSFNGLYRVNLKGNYNVPYGYRKCKIYDQNQFLTIQKRFENVIFQSGDFELVLENIKENDIVFLDPPYVVSHYKNGFIKYNKKLFSLSDQYRLKDVISSICKVGAFYVLTNAAHKTIFEIFSKDSNFIELYRNSLIGGKKAERGKVMELLFTNIPYDLKP